MAENQVTIALNAIQERLNAKFGGPTPVDFARYEPGFSFNALAGNTRAQSEVFRDARNNCIGLKLYNFNYSQDDATVSSSAPTLDCTIAAGDKPVTQETTFTPNLFVRKTVSVDDNVCGKFFSNPSADGSVRAAEYVASQIMDGMQALRKGLDREVPARLNTLRQTTASTASLLPYMANTWDDTNNVWELEYNLFKTPDTFTGIRAMNANNGIGDYFMMCGIHTFYDAFVNSQWRRENSEERFLTRFGTEDLAFDIFNMDSVLNTIDGNETPLGYMFTVARNSYGVLNYSDYQATPTRLELHEKPTWVFTVEDPILRIWDNGTIRPVQYDVHYQTSCDTSDGKLNYAFEHNFQMFFKGGFHGAPVATAGRTGIFKFKTVPGI